MRAIVRLGALLAAGVLASGCADASRPAGPRQGAAIDGGTSATDAGDTSCGAGLTSCGAECVDTASDVRNCGSCGNACAAGEVCSGSICLSGGCPGGTTDCSGSCIDTETSAAHCGGCGLACPSGSSCVAGECACGGGLSLCGGTCVDTSTDSASCGGCGNACGAGQQCSGGSCVACGEGISFAADVQPIFTANCTTGCHGGRVPSSGLDLSAGSAYEALVGVPSMCPDGRLLVAPGDAEASLLYQKVADVGGCGGSRMPLGRSPLSSEEIATIRGWICGGARDD